MDPNLSAFYLEKSEPAKGCLYALRDIILKFDPSIREAKKYGMPCFLYEKKPFCYLWTDKKSDHPYILVVEGNKIDHPSLEKGNRARMKTMTINPVSDLDIENIIEVLELAKTVTLGH
ncbi:MAG: DUF1801 domain-containing protein [Reichenbachiella sp.]|uniref:DUF1801 domain-containing protein n=1 Tax=Reichenbachiella sp. TaxID=2184521 RepID=UPI003263665D